MQENEQKVSIHAFEVLRNATSACKRCFSPIKRAQISDFGEKSCLCDSCKNDLEPRFRHQKWKGINIYWIYDYNEVFRNCLFYFKGCGDFEMREIFLNQKAKFLKLKFKNHIVVPAPSYYERDEKRGFNHVVSIYELLGLPMLDCLIKTEDRKQADLNFEERKKIGSVIKLRENVVLSGKRILFVDDVMTSGSTILACLSLLKNRKPSKIDVLVLARVTRT